MLARYAGIGIIQVDFERNSYPTSMKPEWTISPMPQEMLYQKRRSKASPSSLEQGKGSMCASNTLADTACSLRDAKTAPTSSGYLGGRVYRWWSLFHIRVSLQKQDCLANSRSSATIVLVQNLWKTAIPETLTREELIVLARRQQAQREVEKVKIKREGGEENHRLPVLERNAYFEDDEELERHLSSRRRGARTGRGYHRFDGGMSR